MKTSMLRSVSLLALACAALSASAQNLVVNGDFSTGSFAPDWSVSGSNVSLENNGVGFTTPYARFGAIGSTGTLSQTIATSTGSSYTFEFDLINSGGTPNSFVASFGGSTVLSLLDSPSFGVTHFSYSVLATSGSTTISFTGRQDPSFYRLDNVSVTPLSTAAVPGPLAALPFALMALKRRKRA